MLRTLEITYDYSLYNLKYVSRGFREIYKEIISKI